MENQTPTRRPKGRTPEKARPISIETGVNRYAEGSALIKMGNTHVLCTASVEEKVPLWLEGGNKGWVTADYSMLPRSTHTRNKRDREKVSGRTQEIQRLIARSLRAAVDLKKMPEKMITVDCDVLQADGGTRTASITGGTVALYLALHKLHKEGLIQDGYWIDTVAAISIGIKNGIALADLDYEEDSRCEVDMNFVITGNSEFVEVQGTAERKPFTIQQMDSMRDYALNACKDLAEFQKKIIENTINKK